MAEGVMPECRIALGGIPGKFAIMEPWQSRSAVVDAMHWARQPVRVDYSSTHGYGLFAKVDILKGALIIG